MAKKKPAKAKPESTADRLRLHNQASLIKQAQAKIAAGKVISRREEKAIEDAEAEKRLLVELPHMERMTKGEFCERFGGSYKLFLNWRRRWGFPWGTGGHVNALEILRWFRGHVADDPTQAADHNRGDDGHIQRLKRAQADLAELQLARESGKLIPAIEVEEDFKAYATVISEAIDALGAISRDAQRVMLDALDRITQEFGIEDEEEA